MEDSSHNLTTLFDQLGLPSSDEAIEAFINEHRPLDPSIHLSKASFWTPGQAQFLGEQTKADADWVMVIDKLDTSLRQQ
jgi:hypothetical protein